MTTPYGDADALCLRAESDPDTRSQGSHYGLRCCEAPTVVFRITSLRKTPPVSALGARASNRRPGPRPSSCARSWVPRRQYGLRPRRDGRALVIRRPRCRPPVALGERFRPTSLFFNLRRRNVLRTMPLNWAFAGQ